MKKNNSKKEGFFHHKFTNSPIPDIQQVETQEKKKPGNEINKRTRSKSKEQTEHQTEKRRKTKVFVRVNSKKKIRRAEGRRRQTSGCKAQPGKRKQNEERGEEEGGKRSG